jgi:hypothetical protein
MRRVGVEEAAAVGAELLDRRLARDRTHRQHLLRPFNGRHRDVVREILDRPLLHEQQGQDERRGEKEVQGAANQVDPEVADAGARTAGNPARQGDRAGDPRRGGRKVVEGELHHLRQIRHRRFARVRLPVRIGRE